MSDTDDFLDSHGQPRLVSIQTLAPRPLELKRPIYPVVQPEDGGFVASFMDADISGSGETEQEAIEMLKDMIDSSYRLFCRKESCLGDGPRRQLAVLRQYLEER